MTDDRRRDQDGKGQPQDRSDGPRDQRLAAQRLRDHPDHHVGHDDGEHDHRESAEDPAILDRAAAPAEEHHDRRSDEDHDCRQQRQRLPRREPGERRGSAQPDKRDRPAVEPDDRRIGRDARPRSPLDDPDRPRKHEREIEKTRPEEEVDERGHDEADGERPRCEIERIAPEKERHGAAGRPDAREEQRAGGRHGRPHDEHDEADGRHREHERQRPEGRNEDLGRWVGSERDLHLEWGAAAKDLNAHSCAGRCDDIVLRHEPRLRPAQDAPAGDRCHGVARLEGRRSSWQNADDQPVHRRRRVRGAEHRARRRLGDADGNRYDRQQRRHEGDGHDGHDARSTDSHATSPSGTPQRGVYGSGTARPRSRRQGNRVSRTPRDSTPTPRRIVITGGAGLVGRAVVRVLRERGDTVVALVREPRRRPAPHRARRRAGSRATCRTSPS